MIEALAALALVVAGGVAWVDARNPFFNDLGWLALLGVFAAGLSWRRRSALAWVVAAAVWAWTARTPTGPAPVRVVVLGVDGATFDVLDAGEFPGFAALARDGARATLRSVEPMFSPLLWTTIASGRTVEEHGVRGFRVHASDCKVARFWDVAERAGWRIGLYKWLVDYPPRRVEGFWVPSWLAPGIETWPPSLSAVKELELSRRMRRQKVAATRSAPELAWALAGAGMRLSTLISAVAWSAEERLGNPPPVRANVRMQLLRGRIDRDVFLAQLYAERPELATFTYYATDGLAHLYWDRPEIVAQAYRQVDGILQEIRSHLGPEARLVVVSDHGFRAMDDAGAAGQFVPRTERLRTRLGVVEVTRVGRKLTVAGSTRAAVEALLDREGRPFYRVEEVGGLLALTLANEEVTPERLRTDTVGGEPIAEYIALTEAYTGTHDAAGVFYAAGPGVTPGAILDEVRLIDVAPTVLAAAGLPAAKNMGGTSVIWPEAQRVDSWDALVAGFDWIDGAEGVEEERLRALGYVD